MKYTRVRCHCSKTKEELELERIDAEMQVLQKKKEEIQYRKIYLINQLKLKAQQYEMLKKLQLQNVYVMDYGKYDR